MASFLERINNFKPDSPLFQNMVFSPTGERANVSLGEILGAGAAAQFAIFRSPEVALAAAGKVPTSFKAVNGRFIPNTKVAKIRMAYFTKLIKSAGGTIRNPAFMLSLLASIPFTKGWAANELSDAATSLTIGARDAEKAGDLEKATQFRDMIADLANPSVWEDIISWIPGVNVAYADLITKIPANLEVAEAIIGRLEQSAGEGEVNRINESLTQDDLKKQIHGAESTDEVISASEALTSINAVAGTPTEETTPRFGGKSGGESEAEKASREKLQSGQRAEQKFAESKLQSRAISKAQAAPSKIKSSVVGANIQANRPERKKKVKGLL